MNYLLPRRIRPEFKPHLELCQWGDYVDRDTGERYKILDNTIARKLNGQCAVSFVSHSLGPPDLRGSNVTLSLFASIIDSK